MDIKNLLVLKHAIKDFPELKDDDGYPVLFRWILMQSNF